MSTELKNIFNNIRANLKLDASSKKEILYELYSHFEDTVEELKQAGLSEEEATKAAAQHFGSAKGVANELNQAHTSSDWAQTIIAALPHLLIALLFALRQWGNIFWLVAVIGSIAGAVIYGLRRNKPAWFFTWLGYALIPLMVVGFILILLLAQASSLISINLNFGWWVWLVAVAYFPLMWWILIPIAIQTIKRDWLLSSLMVLPIPAIVGWFLAVQQDESPLDSGELFYNLEPWIALSFLTLAGVVILFIRLRQRILKAAVLLIAGLAMLILVARSSGSFSFVNLIILASITLFLIIGPALLGRKLERNEAKAWDHFLIERMSFKH